MKEKIKNNILTIIIMSIGVLLRVGAFIFAKPHIYQHDVTEYSGHFDYAMYIFNNWHLADNNYYEYAQPPINAFLQAIAMKIVSFFNIVKDTGTEIEILGRAIKVSELELYSYTKILTLIYSILTLVIIYKIIKEFDLPKLAKNLFLTFMALYPGLIVMSTQYSNDCISYLFFYLSIYFAIKWCKNKDLKTIILLALSIGIGMLTKISVGLIAFIVGPMMLIIWVRSLAEGAHTARPYDASVGASETVGAKLCEPKTVGARKTVGAKLCEPKVVGAREIVGAKLCEPKAVGASENVGAKLCEPKAVGASETVGASHVGARETVGAKIASPRDITIQLIIFALIVFPIGLSYSTRNYILFGQGFGEISDVVKGTLFDVSMKGYSFVKRYLSFPFEKLIDGKYGIFHDMQEYNIWVDMIKTSTFDEFVLKNQYLWFNGGEIETINSTVDFDSIYPLLFTIYIINLIFWIVGIVSLVYNAINTFIKKIKLPDNLRNLRNITFGLFIVAVIAYLSFNIRYPYSCNSNWRYVAYITFALAGSIVVMVLTIKDKVARITRPYDEVVGKKLASLAVVANVNRRGEACEPDERSVTKCPWDTIPNNKSIILFAVVAINLFLFSSVSPLHSIMNMQYNEWLYYLIGKGIKYGRVPYVDLIDHKGIYLFFLYAIANIIDINHIGLYIVAVAFYYLIALYSYKITYILLDIALEIDKKSKKILSILVATIIHLVSSSYYMSFGTITCETFILAFELIVYYLFIKYLLSDEVEHNRIHALIYGILAGISFFIKANGVLVFVPVAITLLVVLTKKKSYSNLIQNIVFGLLGFVLALLPGIIYCIANNCLYDMIEGSFIINFLYTGTGMPSLNSLELSLIETIVEFKEFIAICVLSLPMLIYIIKDMHIGARTARPYDVTIGADTIRSNVGARTARPYDVTIGADTIRPNVGARTARPYDATIGADTIRPNIGARTACPYDVTIEADTIHPNIGASETVGAKLCEPKAVGAREIVGASYASPRDNNRNIVILYILIIAINTYAVFMSARPYTNYLNFLTPCLIPFIVFFVVVITKIFEQKNKTIMVLSVASIVLANILSYSFTYELSNMNGYAQSKVIRDVTSVYKNYENNKEEPKLLVVGYAPYLYEAFNVLPDEKYFATPVVSRKKYEKPYNAIVDRIESNTEDLIIVAFERNMLKDEEFKQRVYDALSGKYEKIGDVKSVGIKAEVYVKK